MAQELTAERLRELVHYDPDTGIFTRRVRLAQCQKVGERVGSKTKVGYLCAQFFGRLYYLHRLVFLYQTGRWPKGDVDHINGVKDENRFINLRDVCRQVNAQNRRQATPGSLTGLLGAYFNKARGCFFSQIRLPAGGSEHLGEFSTAELAHQAYVAAKRRLHEGCTL